jgi:hypothetical protein
MLLYKKNLNGSRDNQLMVIELEEECQTNGGLPKQTRGHISSKDNLKRDALTLAFGETFEGLMAQREDALSKRDKKRHREEEARCASFIDFTKRALKIEESIARRKAIESKAKLLTEENQIILATLSIMNPVQKAWFEKMQAIIRERSE